MLPLTKQASQYGIATKHGIDMHIEEINRQGGINGKKIECIEFDDEGDPAKAVVGYNYLKEKGVSGIITGVISETALSIVDQFGNDDIPIIMTTASADDVTFNKESGKVYQNVFRIGVTNSFQGEKAAEFAKSKNIGGKNMQRIINALQLGSVYALISLGYSMVYGIISLINFAHGEVIMLGGYIAIVSMSAGLGPILSSTFSIFGCILISFLTEKIAYKPLRPAPRNSIFITAIGVSLFLQNISQIIFSANGKPFPNSNFFPNISFSIFNSDISFVSLITIIISVSLMIILDLVIKYSKLGRAMRAVSEDMQTSRLMGININNVISFTFAIGAALAGIGSVLYFNKYPIVSPVSGYMPGMKAFIAAVLGKIGSIKGAVFGGFLIGFIEIFTISIGLATWLDAIVFGILILVLIFKPSGILGKKVVEKV